MREGIINMEPRIAVSKEKYSKFGPVSNATMMLLQNFYGPFNAKLAKMLGDPAFNWGGAT